MCYRVLSHPTFNKISLKITVRCKIFFNPHNWEGPGMFHECTGMFHECNQYKYSILVSSEHSEVVGPTIFEPGRSL